MEVILSTGHLEVSLRAWVAGQAGKGIYTLSDILCPPEGPYFSSPIQICPSTMAV